MSYRYEKTEPALLLLDFERSLRAAFELEELRSLAARHLPQAKTTGMRLLPFVGLVTTPPRETASDLTDYAKTMRSRLPAHLRADLDHLRLLFKLGGLGSDPFSG